MSSIMLSKVYIKTSASRSVRYTFINIVTATLSVKIVLYTRVNIEKRTRKLYEFDHLT